MSNLENRHCACGKEFEVSKFAPKSTVCPECAITRIATKRRENKLRNVVADEPSEDGPPEYEPGAKGVTQDEIDTDPFSIIAVYNLFGKEAVYLWLILRGFKVTNSGVLFKQYDNIYVVAPLRGDAKFIVSLLNNSGNDVTIESVDDIEALPPGMMSDLLPIASLVWPKRQGGAR
jgi:hypothetical protein